MHWDFYLGPPPDHLQRLLHHQLSSAVVKVLDDVGLEYGFMTTCYS